MPEKSPSINERIESFIRDLDITIDDLAAKTDTSKRTWFRLFKPGASVKHEYIELLVDNFGADINYLFNGDDNYVSDDSNGYGLPTLGDSSGSMPTLAHSESVTTRAQTENGSALDADEFTLVNFYNIRASAGHGNFMRDCEPLPMAFRTYWVKNVIRAAATDLFLIKVDGDSMEPELKNDDMVLINQGDRKVLTDHIYLVRVDDLYKIKRVQRLPGKMFRLCSDNKTYPPVEISTDSDDISIIGRVVWAGKAL